MPPQTSREVIDFLARLPDARRKELEIVRGVVRKHLPAGYEETLTKGMIVYAVPLQRYADTYNGHPLWYAALGSGKNYLTLYLMAVYGSPVLAGRLRDGFKAAGKKLDMGKACIRFRAADDLALDAVGEIVGSVPLERYVSMAKAVQRR